MMANLSRVESRIVEELLVKKYGSPSLLLRQLAAATVGVRQMTGTGYYLDLSVDKNIPSFDRINGDASEGYETKLAPPADLVGFTVFIRNGYLSWLEGYTFGDVAWPEGAMDDWLKLSEPERIVSRIG